MAVTLPTRERSTAIRAARARLEPWPNTMLPVIRERANSDLWFFLTEVLGIRILEPEPHGLLCNWLMNRPNRYGLVLMPRLTLKTTCITEGYSLWQVARDPDHIDRNLIHSDLRANAKKMAGRVKTYIESNRRFRQLYGDLKREPGWTEEYFTVKRAVEGENREPTYLTAGQDAVVVSLHFDRILADDMQNKTNVNTKEAIEKVIEVFKLFDPLMELPDLNPAAECLVIGTRWDDADLYGWMMRTFSRAEDDAEFMDVLRARGEAEFGGLDVFFRGARRPDGSPLWSLFTDEFLRKKQERLGAYLYAANYENDPVPTENQTFRKEDFQNWDRLPDHLTVYVLVDPAISERRHGDFSAIVAVGVDKAARIYVLDAWRQRVQPKELIDNMFYFYNEYGASAMGLETVAFQKALKYMLYDEMARRTQWMTIRELKPDTKDTKEMRIRGLQPYYQQKRVFHRRGLHDLENELLRFPRAQHDDLSDALSYLLQFILPAETKKRSKYEYIPENPVTGY